MISLLWFSGELIPRAEQSQKPPLQMESSSPEPWHLLEGDTASLCAQHLGGTFSSCCFLHGIIMTHGVVLPPVLPVSLLPLLCAAFHSYELFPMGSLIPRSSLNFQ